MLIFSFFFYLIFDFVPPGAPDVFTAYVGLMHNKDIDLVLGELCGASIFIGTLVLGAVLIVADLKTLVREKKRRRRRRRRRRRNDDDADVLLLVC